MRKRKPAYPPVTVTDPAAIDALLYSAVASALTEQREAA